MLKVCTKCKQEKVLDEDFYWDKTNEHYYGKCKECFIGYLNRTSTDRKKIYAKTEKGKKAINKASRKAYLNHKEKWVARRKARYAIKTGVIQKPDECEDCGEKKSLHAHHEDYSKPLEVIFLCFSCHAKADKLLESRSYLQTLVTDEK